MSSDRNPLQKLLEDIQHKTGIPGVIATAASSAQRLSAAAGTASIDTNSVLTGDCRFQLGCITKLLTSLLVVELARTKLINLEAPLGEYIEEFRVIPKAQEIQIQHLASHTSGYQGLNLTNPEVAYFYSWEKFTEYFAEARQLFQPGTVFNYEHSECVILGEIVRRVTGTTTDQMMRELIFEPLGLRVGRIKSDGSEPQLHVADHGVEPSTGRYKVLRTVPYSGFWLSSLSDVTLSTSDLLVLGRAMITATHCKIGRDAIVKSQRQLAHIPETVGGSQHEQMPLSFGLGCAAYAGQLLGHNGSARGQTCAIRFSPEHDLVIIVALNAWQPHLRDWIVNRVADALRTPKPTRPDAAHKSTWKFEELAGTYAGCVRGVTLVAHKHQNKLVCSVTNKGADAVLKVEVTCDAEGRLAVRSDMPHLSLGLFRETVSGSPCIMLAMNAFKRVA